MEIEPHTPPGFNDQGKPHICRVAGQWWALWPAATLGPSPSELAVYGPYLRKLNGVPEPRPNSTLHHAHQTLQ